MTRTSCGFSVSLVVCLAFPIAGRADVAGAPQAPEARAGADTTRDDPFVRSAWAQRLRDSWGADQKFFIGLSDPDNNGTGRDSVAPNGAGAVTSGANSLSVPIGHEERVLEQGRVLRFNSLGLEWARRLDPRHQVSVGAQYGDLAYEVSNGFNASSVLASLGWAGDYGANRSHVGTSVFLGEDTIGEQAYKHLGRRYFGLAVDGSVSLFRYHTPFVSLKLQWSDYDENDPTFLVNRSDDYSRVSAGWDWQVLPNWRLRAEADRTTNTSNLSPYEYDRNRLFFSTQFDFR